MQQTAKKITARGLWTVIKNTVNGFIDDKVTKLSGSLAYATIFSLAPMFVILLTFLGWLLGRDAVEGRLYGQLRSFVGPNTAEQLQEIIKNASQYGTSSFATIVGIITLIVGATTVFAEIQDSINSIWGIKPKPKKGWLLLIKNRLLSFSLIISIGFVLLVSLVLSMLIDEFSNRLMLRYPDVAVVVFYIINVVINFLVISTMFAVIYKVLPDAQIEWKDILAGSITTALLFMLGKFIISFYIAKSNIGNTFGAAASVVILLVWIYYSSLILYFGAEFTKAWAIAFGKNIYPNKYAVSTKIVEVEQKGEALEAINKATVDATHTAVKDAVAEKLEDGIPQEKDTDTNDKT